MNDWLQVQQDGDSPEIIIDGFIGESWADESETSSKRFNATLSTIPKAKHVTVRINSEGGAIKDGIGIYNSIRSRGNVTTRIDGYALSIASIIALAGDEVVSPLSSVWMIHEPWSMAVGDAEDFRRSANSLDTHAEMLTAVYSDVTGIDRDAIRELMREETWFTGEEAVEFGFADKAEGEAKLAALKNPNAFRRVPDAILNFGSKPIGRIGLLGSLLRTAHNSGHSLKKKLSRFGFVAAAGGGSQPPPTVTQTTLSMETPANTTTTPTAEAPTSAPDNRLIALQAELENVKAQAAKEREARIREKVQAVCSQRGLTDADKWIPLALSNEDVIERILALPATHAAPVRNSGIGGGNTWRDQVRSHKRGKERLDFILANWDDLKRAEMALPVNANTGTDDSSLIGSTVESSAITILQHKLAPLMAFTRDFDSNPVAPNQPHVIRKVTAGGTAQSGATSFEDTTNFVGTVVPITVTPTQLTAGGYMNQTEMNRGMRVAQWAEIKAQEIAEKVLNVVTSLITTGNFTATPHTAAAAAFGSDDMKTIFGLIKKANRKFVILDGEYYARLLPSTREDWNVIGAAWPGFDGVYLNTYWTGATANTVGFACDPQAIAVVAGPPALSQNAARAGLATSAFSVPGLDLTISTNSWFANSSRTDWFTLDVCFGAALLDATAGLLIKSS